jgi:hypothetical protein
MNAPARAYCLAGGFLGAVDFDTTANNYQTQCGVWNKRILGLAKFATKLN